MRLRSERLMHVQEVPPGMSTFDVVQKIIRPRTKKRLCRFVVLAEEQSPGAVGRARAFASHTWRAPFLDLVAALCPWPTGANTPRRRPYLGARSLSR